MSDFNNVILLGRCGGSPEVFQGKQPFAKVQIATNKKWRKDNVIHTRTDWHTVVFNRKLAELAEQYLHKGDKVLIKGELQSRKWKTKAGEDRFSVFFQTQELKFLTPKQQHKTEINPEVITTTDETIDETDAAQYLAC